MKLMPASIPIGRQAVDLRLLELADVPPDALSPPPKVISSPGRARHEEASAAGDFCSAWMSSLVCVSWTRLTGTTHPSISPAARTR